LNQEFFFKLGSVFVAAFQAAALRNIEVAGVKDWFRPHPRAYGAACSLYERHPVTRQNAGDPIADSFAVVARENSAILVLADGVNWGEKAKLASRSAVHGCVEYLNKVLYIDSFRSPARARPKNTSVIIRIHFKVNLWLIYYLNCF